MKPVELAFAADAKAGKPAPRHVHELADQEARTAITEFKVSDETAVKPRKARKVIARQPNQLRAAVKDDPAAVGKLEDRFEGAAKQEEGALEYGLVQSVRPLSTPTGITTPASVVTSGKLQEQALTLAEAPTSEAYEDMPVEDFGMALLRGMGMTEENKVETVEYIARPARMGLGVDPSKIATGKRSYKHLVGADGSIKSVMRKGDAVIDAATLGPRKGKRMTVAAGRHAGLECIVRELDPDGREGMVMVRLLPSEHDIALAADRLAEPGMLPAASAPSSPDARHQSAAAKPSGRAMQSQSSKSQRYNGHKAAAQDDGSRLKEGTDRTPPSGRQREEPSAATWLREGIRVRVVDKHEARGALYLKKGTVLYMTGRHKCAVQMDTGSVREGIADTQLETVISKQAQTPVIVLRGCHVGRHARLLEKQRSMALLELTDSRNVAQVALDDVADFQGLLEGEDF